MGDCACGIVINGCHTDIVLKSYRYYKIIFISYLFKIHLQYCYIFIYSNRTLLIITQFKKFGTLLTINRESSVNGYNSDVYTIK